MSGSSNIVAVTDVGMILSMFLFDVARPVLLSQLPKPGNGSVMHCKNTIFRRPVSISTSCSTTETLSNTTLADGNGLLNRE